MRILGAVLALLPLMAAAQNFQPCMKAGATGEPFGRISNKVSLVSGPNGITPQMLALTDKPTEPEKVAIATWADLYGRCFRGDVPARAKLPADAAAVIESGARGVLTLSARLYAGELTYGQYNAARSEFGTKVGTAFGQIGARMQAKADINDPARKKALQDLLQSQPQMGAEKPSSGAAANCFQFGKQSTCISG